MSVTPGNECPSCGRKVPEVHDKPPSAKQTRFTIAEPVGEGGVLDELLVQLVERYQEIWPEDLGKLGDKGWRYRALHFGLYALITAPHAVAMKLCPAEEGG